jgi:hypothetical protein
LGSNRSCPLLNRVSADAIRQEFCFHTLGELACLWYTSVVNEAAPSHVLSETEVILCTREERAPVVAYFRSRSIIVRGLSNHRSQP